MRLLLVVVNVDARAAICLKMSPFVIFSVHQHRTAIERRNSLCKNPLQATPAVNNKL